MTPHLPEILFAVATVAGFVDAIAGGGGLITVPSMFLLGVPPTVVLGTNRCQAAVGELTSVMTYWRAKEIDRRLMVQSALGVGVGSLVGTLLAIALPIDWFARIIPILMGVVLLYAIFAKRMRSDVTVAPKMSVLAYAMVPAVALGFYNGFFGPGTGAFLVASLMLLLGKSLKNATINAKPLNFFGNLVSLVFFLIAGKVDLTLALVMSAGQPIGAYVGSRLVISRGTQLIRPIFIGVTALMMAKMLWSQYG